jgi:PAS domain S-box-containing protein
MTFPATPVKFTGPGNITGEEILARDWSSTSLGPIDAWPAPLRSTLALMLACPTPMFLAWGPDLICLFNDAYRPILGYRLDTALGRPFRDVWASIWPEIEPLVTATLAGEMRTMTDMPLDLSRGGVPEQSWWTFSYSPAFDDDGNVAGLFCVTWETTARIIAALECDAAYELGRKNEDRHRLRVEISDALRRLETPWEIMAFVAERLGPYLGVDRAGYYQVDDDHFIISEEWRTPDVVELIGRHPMADFGQGTIDLLLAGGVLRFDDTSGVEGAEAYAANGMTALLSVPVHHDGRWAAGLHVAQSQQRAWTDGEEELIREVGVQAWAAVERVRAEDQLRRLNDTLEQLVDERTAERDRMWATSPDLMLVIDFDGFFRRVNPAWEVLLGYTADDLVGHHVDEFVVPDDRADPVAAHEHIADGGHPRIENRYRHRDGSLRWISWTSAPAGDMTYATGRDITVEKERQAELEAAQEQLRQSQKMEAMGQLTGGVAHDFNNLLTPIIGSLDLLIRKGIGTDRERRLIDGALQSAERAKTLVQRLLAFARRQPLQPTAVDVTRLLAGMQELLGSTLGPRIDINVDVPAALPPACADPNQLEMALLNLAVNARDAMPDGGQLTIAARRETFRARHAAGMKPGHYVRISITDTGNGMDEKTLRRATEPFFSTKGVGKGTGLGLSMVHGLAAQLSGGLSIESTPGQGTTIDLWLPISAAVVDDGGRGSESLPRLDALGIALLVDDEDLVRMTTADMLADLGYEVIEARSAEEAIGLLGDGLTPALVVTDHLMPGMSGAELARRLKAGQPDMPVLIVSGYADVEGVDTDIARLTKPFRAADLARSLSVLLSPK